MNFCLFSFTGYYVYIETSSPRVPYDRASFFEIQRSKQKDGLLFILLSYVRGSCQGTESLQRRKQNLEHEGRSGRLVEKGGSDHHW